MPGDSLEFQTRWSQIDRLHADQATQAWRWFITRYHGYVAAVLRQRLARSEDAEAAADEFWGYLFDSRAIERADHGGRFRSFLAGIVRKYASSWRRKQSPGRTAEVAIEDLAAAPRHNGVDEDLLWAQQILHLGLGRLGETHAEEARALQDFYGIPEHPGAEPRPRQRATVIAEQLGCKANAIHQTLFRARNRLRECILAEIAVTTASNADLQDELRTLMTAFDRAAPGLVDGPDAGGEG